MFALDLGQDKYSFNHYNEIRVITGKIIMHQLNWHKDATHLYGLQILELGMEHGQNVFIK